MPENFKATPVVDMTDESWNHAVNLNLNHILGNEEIFTTYDSSRMGRIIAISSVEGKMSLRLVATTQQRSILLTV